jgi:outer membrane protein
MKKTLFILLLFPFFGFGQQIGYVDVQTIFQAMPERESAQVEINAFMQSLVDDLHAMEFNYEQKIKEYEQLGPEASPTVRASLEERILRIENELNAFRQSSEADIRAREDELMQPIHNKILQTVELVAKEKGYAHVFDASTALIFPAENDFTKAVLSRLGL